MSASVVDIVTISQVVQAAVAPVFLITGVATLLGILSNRQGKLLDEALTLQGQMDVSDEGAQMLYQNKMNLILRRKRLISGAFTFCSLSALVVCLVVVMLFYSSVATVPLAQEISVLFIAAMSLLFFGLLILLREIFLAGEAITMPRQ